MMNIKQVEKLTGISSQNIRFYEKSGLIHPKRNEEMDIENIMRKMSVC